MRVLLSSQSARSIQPLRPVAHSLGLECDATDCVSFDNLRLRLTTEPAAELLVVLAEEDELAAMLAVKQGTSARLPVVALVEPQAAGLHAQLMGAGARKLVETARFREGLQLALDEFYTDGTFRSRRGRVIAVTAAQGGCGVTTAATAVAFALGAAAPGRALLAELSGTAPQLALDLDLKPAHGLAGLVRDHERCDPRMVRQVAVAHPAGVHVLAHDPEPFLVPVVPAAVMRHLVVLLREMYDHLVLDIGAYIRDGGGLEALRLAESVVLMTRPEVPALRLARAYVKHLRDLGIPADRIRPVANRTGYGKQVARAEAEKVIGQPFAEWVPDDVNTVAAALFRGEPLQKYYPGATITRTFGRLAKALAASAS